MKPIRVLILGFAFALSTGAYAAKKPSAGKALPAPAAPKAVAPQTESDPPAATATSGAAEEDVVEVERIKKKYWTQGEEGDVGVVQNRLYTKAKKFELQGFGGFHDSDPFLSTKTYGGTFGYHFNEYFSLHALYFKYSVQPSSALKTFQSQMRSTTNTNEPRHFIGGEMNASILYGKLSLVGKKILYFDLRLIGGAGQMTLENNKSISPLLGIGQTIYLHRSIALRADYRWMHYSETIKGKVPASSDYGQVIGKRTVDSNTITLGISFFLAPF